MCLLWSIPIYCLYICENSQLVSKNEIDLINCKFV